MVQAGGLVLVTGGSGFVGSSLVRQLLADGFRVRILDLSKPRGLEVDGIRLEFVLCDVRNENQVGHAVNGCSAVFHLAADPKLWRKQRSQYHPVNYLGTKIVLDKSLQAGVDVVVHVSTESILTKKNQLEVIEETQDAGVSDAIGAYCRSKMRAELYALSLGRKGAPVLVVNPTLPVGPGDYGLCPPSRMIVDFCNQGRREYIDGDLNLADVRDIAKGMVLAAQKGEPGRRYILSGHNHTIKEVFEMIARLRNMKAPDRKIPYWVALGFAFASELVADLITGQQPQANVTGVLLTRRIMRFHQDVALRQMGWEVRDLNQSLGEAMNWFHAHGMIR